MFQLVRWASEARESKPSKTGSGVGIMPPRQPTHPRPVFIMLTGAQDQQHSPSATYEGEVNGLKFITLNWESVPDFAFAGRTRIGALHDHGSDGRRPNARSMFNACILTCLHTIRRISAAAHMYIVVLNLSTYCYQSAGAIVAFCYLEGACESAASAAAH